MQKKKTTLGLLLLSAVAIAGCGPANQGGSAPSDGSPTNANVGSHFKVALVLSGPTTDGGWNAGAAHGLDVIQQELKLDKNDVAMVDNQKSAGDQEKNLRAFAGKKYNMVIGHGNEYEELALKMESEFPKTLFVISSGQKTGNNTTPIVLQLEDGAYLEGMLAAGMSKTGKLGAVGADAIPPVKSVFTAFEKGAKAVNPKIIMLPPIYTNSWDDPNKAKQAAIPLIEKGADIIMQDVDAAAPGVFDAVKEKNKPDHPVYALGTNKDQNEAAPDVILASAPIYIEKAYLEIAKAAKEGTFKPSAAPFSMKSGAIGFVLNPKLKGKISPALLQKLTDAEKKIRDGSLDVTKG